MLLFRILLVAILACLIPYTLVVVNNHGLILFTVFFGDMLAMAWPGQFNLDFMCMLALSGLWLAWRNQFSPLGLVLGVFGFLGGAPVLSAYLLYVSFEAKGDMKEVLLGKSRLAVRA